MTTDPETEKTKPTKRERYVPNLAEFYFRPTFDWSRDEAEKEYDSRQVPGGFPLDQIRYKDCIEGVKRLPDESIDLVIADPPFGINFDGLSGVYNRDEEYVVEGYQEPIDSYEDFTLRWMAELPRVMNEESSAYIFSGWNNLEYVLRGAREAGLVTLNHIIWHYPFGVFTKCKFVSSHYHVLFLVKDQDKYFFNKVEHYPEDVWLIKRKYRAGRSKNGTKLPFELVSKCIDFSSRPGDIVLDPFMGNGTTAVASKANWRHFVGFEINGRLKPVVNKDIEQTEPGSAYTPYTERIPTVEELAEQYPKAYKEYLKREGET